MYTILITESHELVTTVKERIMQRSKLVDNLHFLMRPYRNGMDMSQFTVYMEYLLPVSREYHSETLTLSDRLYKGMLEYVLPFDTDLTSEAGDIEIQLSFVDVDLDADGNDKQIVRKTSSTTITIIPITAWSDIIPDDSLTAIDQRLIKAEAIIKELEETGTLGDSTKADNLIIEDNRISLLSNGEKIGTEWDIVTPKINDGDFDGTYDGILELDKE